MRRAHGYHTIASQFGAVAQPRCEQLFSGVGASSRPVGDGLPGVIELRDHQRIQASFPNKLVA
jgi:hypothetical protein